MMDIHAVIGKLPRPEKGFVLPYHKYTGPYNPLHKQLDEFNQPLPGQEPYNAVDAISMRHDICYRDHGTTKQGKHDCDDEMLRELDVLHPKTLRERSDKKLVQTIIGTKRKLGWGIQGDDEDEDWTNELTDELHKPIRKKFRKRIVFAKNVDSIWAADLVDMQYYARTNQGYKYILMIIDVFSKYGWTIPLKTKKGEEVAKAFEGLWKVQSPPKMLWTDKGKEFVNKDMTALLQKHNVHLYWTENEEKSCIVERWNRTIKRIMWKYFTRHQTGRYIDILSDMIKKYNSTYHRSIKCTPTDARKPANYQHVFDALYNSKNPRVREKQTPKFKIGDKVRITKKKKTFEKGYTTNWTEEIFTVVKVQPTIPFTYKIEDTRGEEIQGTFYEEELQKTKQESLFRIEKVLRRRTRKDGVKEVYVKWKGYSNIFNQWIPETDIQ